MSSPNQNRHVQFEQVSAELQSIFKQQSDIGVFEIISGWVLEQRNIFDPSSRRRPKPELLLALAYLLLLASGFAVFNLE
jgi:hypothetical protein